MKPFSVKVQFSNQDGWFSVYMAVDGAYSIYSPPDSLRLKEKCQCQLLLLCKLHSNKYDSHLQGWDVYIPRINFPRFKHQINQAERWVTSERPGFERGIVLAMECDNAASYSFLIDLHFAPVPSPRAFSKVKTVRGFFDTGDGWHGLKHVI